MKSLVSSWILVVLLSLPARGQSDKFPHITSDNFETQNYTIGIQMRFQIPMPLGLGVDGSFYIPGIIHADGEFGYGWTYVTDQSEESTAKTFMPWVRAHAGWPLHIPTSTNIKYTTSIAQTSSTESQATYYRVKAPSHIFIIPEVGIYMNPMGQKINANRRETFMARSFAFGIALKVLTNVNVKVRDSESGRVYSGPFKSYGHIRFGMLRPLDEEIIVPERDPLQPSDKGRFYVNVQWNVPHYDYGFGLGLQSLGYDNKAALYFTWTFYVK